MNNPNQFGFAPIPNFQTNTNPLISYPMQNQTMPYQDYQNMNLYSLNEKLNKLEQRVLVLENKLNDDNIKKSKNGFYEYQSSLYMM